MRTTSINGKKVKLPPGKKVRRGKFGGKLFLFGKRQSDPNYRYNQPEQYVLIEEDYPQCSKS